ncbi:uncharacterized protein [Clytia hemisphaerica]
MAAQQGNNNNNNDNQGNDEICGFVHNVSPLKRSSDGRRNYFECLIQEKNQTQRTLCFSPNKRRCLDDAMVSKTPVKITNCNVQRGQLFINNGTDIRSCPKEEVDFNHNKKLAANAILSLTDLSEISSGQVVTIKANVLTVPEPITHYGRQGKIPKQEVTIRDDRKTCKLTLYGEDVGTIEAGKTYIMKNLRVNITRNTFYLNSTQNLRFVVEDAAPFKNLTDQECQTESTDRFRIVGVSTITVTYHCPKCGRSTQLNDGHRQYCSECKSTLREMDCSSTWSVSIMMREVDSGEVIKIYFPNNQTRNLASLIDHTIRSKDEFQDKLLDIQNDLDITFDVVTKVATNVKFTSD